MFTTEISIPTFSVKLYLVIIINLSPPPPLPPDLISKLIPAYITDWLSKKETRCLNDFDKTLYLLVKVAKLVLLNIFKFLVMGTSGTTTDKH